MPRKPHPKIEGYDDQTAAILIGISRRTLLRHLHVGLITPPTLMRGKTDREGRTVETPKGKNWRAWRDDDIQRAKSQIRERDRERPN
jgi:hypothetical protein